MAEPRDLTFEENALTVVGRSVDNVPELVRLARERADEGGRYRPPAHRVMRTEALEECADLANYLTWWLQDVLEGREEADPIAIGEALSGVVHVFGIIEALPARAAARSKLPVTHQMAGAKRTVRIAGVVYEMGPGGELRPYEAQ